MNNSGVSLDMFLSCGRGFLVEIEIRTTIASPQILGFAGGLTVSWLGRESNWTNDNYKCLSLGELNQEL